MRLKAQEIYEKKEQEAATRIQAVYRGYTVRKNLKWQHLTGLPDIADQVSDKKSINFDLLSCKALFRQHKFFFSVMLNVKKK